MAVPARKRLVLVDNLNTSERNWKYNDNDYTESVTGAVKEGFWDSVLKDVDVSSEKGAVIGGFAFGMPGMLVGGLVGAIVGGLCALVTKPIKRLRSKRGAI